jgi:hypothetical protein
MSMRPMVGALVMALLPSLALAQTPDERIEAARQRAMSAGLPVALLESKVAEGRAKGVAMDRIAAAVEAREAALLRSREAMRVRSDVSPAELGLGAEALQSGVSAAVLTAITERAPGEHRAVAIAALTQLVLLGNVSEDALARVTAALARGPEALLNLPAQAQAAQRRGPPDSPPGQGVGRTNNPGGGPPPGVPGPGQRGQSGKPPKVDPPGSPPGG